MSGPLFPPLLFLLGTIYASRDALLQGIPGLFPGFDSSLESFGVPVALLHKFDCPTGRGVFIGSVAVKDNFLLLLNVEQPVQEMMQRFGSLEMHRLELFI
jgi:hypothetical protein